MGHIYNMKNQFWAGLGSRAVLVKKKFGADYEQLLRPVFICFHGEKKKKNFAHENIKKRASKVAHNRPKLFFLTSMARLHKPAQN